MSNINDLKDTLLNNPELGKKLKAAEKLAEMASEGNDDATNILYEMLKRESNPRVRAKPFEQPFRRGDTRERFFRGVRGLFILPLFRERKITELERDTIIRFAKSIVDVYEGHNWALGGTIDIIAHLIDEADLLTFVDTWLKKDTTDVYAFLYPFSNRVSLLKKIILQLTVNPDYYPGKFVKIFDWFLQNPNPDTSEAVGKLWLLLPSNYKEAIKLYYCKKMEQIYHHPRKPPSFYVMPPKHPFIEWLESFERRAITSLPLICPFIGFPSPLGSKNIMFDPSLLLAMENLDRVISFVKQQHEEFLFYISQTFYNFLAEYEETDLSYRITKFFDAEQVNLEKVKKMISKNADYFTFFQPAKEYYTKYSYFYENLSADEGIDHEWLGKILFEEFVFLQEYSWIVAKSKKTFKKFKEYGSIAVEFSEKAVDKLIRKTLKKKDDDFINAFDKLRALGKWIAVGGSSATSLFNPYLAFFVGAITGIFWLLDPRNQKWLANGRNGHGV